MARLPGSAAAVHANVARPAPSCALALCALLSLYAAPVHADQRRDFMLTFTPPGDYGYIDFFGTGAMFSAEHRQQIFGNSNDLTIGAAFIPAYPLLETHARADLRILFLGLGATIGYRTVWRDLVFEPGDHGEYCKDCDRASRRRQDPIFSSTPGSDTMPLAEGRATIYLPLNDHVIGLASGALRYEGGHDRHFDWYYTSVYDAGLLERFEGQLYFKHPALGGLGPYVQLLMLPRDGGHHAQWAAGFNLVTRLGLLPRNDLLYWTFLIRPGDGIYGQQSYFAPVRSLLVYRIILDL